MHEVWHPDTFTSLPLHERVQLVLVGLDDAEGSHGNSPRSSAAARTEQFYASDQPRPTVGRHSYTEAITEAFDYLAREGLTTASSRQGGGTVVLTSSGREIRKSASPIREIESRKLLALPLHDRLAAARRSFENGDLDNAVLNAFKAVESHVKAATGIKGQGREVMSDAFKPGGPLADPDGEDAEVLGVKFLFMGAIGALRNPVAHRQDVHHDAAEVASMVVFADLLMRLVDRAVARGRAS